MKKTNKKGFTLIELLATIAIIGVIMAISIVGINTYIEKAENKKIAISENNFKNSAITYAAEFYNDSDWMNVEDGTISKDSLFTCVSKKQIIDKGMMKNKETNNIGFDYIILEKNNINKTVKVFSTLTKTNLNKELGELEGNNIINYQVCKNTLIENPTGESETYTDTIETDFIVNPILEKFPTEKKREIEEIKCILNENEKTIEPINDEYNDNQKKCIFTGLSYQDGKKYKVSLKVKYKNKENIYIGSVEEELKQLTIPQISVDGKTSEVENEYKKQKNIKITYFNDNIYNKDNQKNYYKYNSDYIEEQNNEIDFSVNENTIIYAKITDGTNEIETSKKIKYIDNINYQCQINAENYSTDYKTADLNVYIYDNNSNKVSSNFIIGYQWSGENYNKVNGNEDNYITTKNVSTNGNYSITLTTRRKDEVTCTGNASEIPETTPQINIVAYKKENNTRIDTGIWHNYSIYANLVAEDGTKIYYCTVDSVEGNCTPDIEINNPFATISHEVNGIKKIIAISADDKGKESVPVSAILKFDNVKPTCKSSNGSNNWSYKDVTIKGKCDDSNGSGCTGDVSKTFTGNNNTTVSPGTVYDNAGNETVCPIQTVKIDVDKPNCYSSNGSNNWRNEDVTIKGTCADTGGSGCTGNVSKTFTGNTNTTESPGTVKDKAGNETLCPTQTVKIDVDVPTCKSSNGSNNWRNKDVTISGTCTDTGGSGCTGNVSKTFKGNTNTTISPGTVYDNAGNKKECPVQTVKIDVDDPVFTFNPNKCNTNDLAGISEGVVVFSNKRRKTKGTYDNQCWDTTTNSWHSDKSNFTILKKGSNGKYTTSENVLVRTQAIDSGSGMDYIAIYASGATKHQTFENTTSDVSCSTTNSYSNACSRIRNIYAKGESYIGFKACDLAGNCAETSTYTIVKDTNCEDTVPSGETCDN